MLFCESFPSTPACFHFFFPFLVKAFQLDNMPFMGIHTVLLWHRTKTIPPYTVSTFRAYSFSPTFFCQIVNPKLTSVISLLSFPQYPESWIRVLRPTKESRNLQHSKILLSRGMRCGLNLERNSKRWILQHTQSTKSRELYYVAAPHYQSIFCVKRGIMPVYAKCPPFCDNKTQSEENISVL